MESVSAWINDLTGGNGIEGLGDISKLTGLLGSKGLGLGLGNRFPILLILALILLFGNKGGNFNSPQYACCCCKRKHRRHHRRCDCSCGCSSCGNQFGSCGYGCGYGNRYGSGYGNIIFIIIILLIIQFGKKNFIAANTSTGSIFNFSGNDAKDTEDNLVYTDADEEE
ncbi:hypothetical protein CLHOM_30920 [Clostridium homopropionicum DSM 5847]|uniref:Uncharacterized protein n=2 Tax=Clostridium TaxID=1485 RepID=A0A0L6Z5H2_9CLOT|nr:hypothetical protein CLHOM_30920 [Clostridium homopropionicum DSM 5847]SFF71162.1 hypothetical protein SAMN04488501_101389 [Clostridium homopropionicum]